MKKKFLATIVATGAILSGCSGDKAANNSNGGGESTMTGVAAVGAPIANGFVEVKGANGTIVSATTSASGVYNVGLKALTSPYLVRVTSPTGQRYFTVASKEDVSASKKINITPITHTIIANVFKDKSPDTLFENFTTKSNEYSQSAVNLAKNDFKQKMIDAGVLGSAGILTDTEIDLMNGSFVAGSGAGVDKLLDALDIDVEKGASNIEVNLKSGQKIYSNDVSDPTKPVTILDLSAAITATNSQLVLLGKIKESLNNINKIFKTVALCSGPAVVGGSCDKDTLNTRVEGILHADYKYSGLNRTVDSWSYFCSEEEVDGDKEATNSESCNFIN